MLGPHKNLFTSNFRQFKIIYNVYFIIFVMSNKLYEIMSKIFDVDISAINDQSSPETIERWDSFHGLALVDALENEFNVKFSLLTHING